MITKEQKMARYRGLGGSDAAAVCGLSPWQTPVDLYMNKTGFLDRMAGGTDPVLMMEDEEQTKAQSRGSILEPFVIEFLRERMNIHAKVCPDTMVHKDHPFLMAHVDGFLDDGKKLLEIKTSAHREGWGESFSDEVPAPYICQVHHYMNVCGVDEAVVAVLFGSHKELDMMARIVARHGELEAVDLVEGMDLDIRLYTIKKNEALARVIQDREVTFWTEHVMKRVCPAPSCMDDIKALFPCSKEEQAIADEKAEAKVSEVKSFEEEIKKLEKLKAEAQKTIAEAMGACDTLVSLNGSILATWKSHERQMLDTKALMASMPHLAQQFAVRKPVRIFRLAI